MRKRNKPLECPQIFLTAVKYYRIHATIQYNNRKFSGEVDLASFFILFWEISYNVKCG